MCMHHGMIKLLIYNLYAFHKSYCMAGYMFVCLQCGNNTKLSTNPALFTQSPGPIEWVNNQVGIYIRKLILLSQRQSWIVENTLQGMKSTTVSFKSCPQSER